MATSVLTWPGGAASKPGDDVFISLKAEKLEISLPLALGAAEQLHRELGHSIEQARKQREASEVVTCSKCGGSGEERWSGYGATCGRFTCRRCGGTGRLAQEASL